MGYFYNNPNLVGKASAIIDAELEDVAALEYLVGSRRRMKAFYSSKGGVVREVKVRNDHCFTVRSVSDLMIPLFGRRVFTTKVSRGNRQGGSEARSEGEALQWHLGTESFQRAPPPPLVSGI